MTASEPLGTVGGYTLHPVRGQVEVRLDSELVGVAFSAVVAKPDGRWYGRKRGEDAVPFDTRNGAVAHIVGCRPEDVQAVLGGDLGGLKTKVYLAGPMSALPDFNTAAFAEAERYALAQGWRPVNPHHTDPAHDGPCPPGERHTRAGGSHPYPCWLRASLRRMLTSDAVLLLPGWQDSKGARRERAIAEWCDMPVYDMPAGGDVA